MRAAPPHATGMCDVMSMCADVGGLASDSTTTSAYFYDPQFLGTWCSCGVGPAGVFVDQNCAALYGYVRLLGADDGTSAILKSVNVVSSIIDGNVKKTKGSEANDTRVSVSTEGSTLK